MRRKLRSSSIKVNGKRNKSYPVGMQNQVRGYFDSFFGRRYDIREG